jgi:DNA-binding MarR family transcriptional regulator
VCEPAGNDGARGGTDRVVDALMTGAHVLTAVSEEAVAAAGTVTVSQYRMMLALQSHASNLTGLAQSLGVAPSTAMRMADRLIAGGLVNRTAKPGNRRETVLSLTTRGHRTVERVTERHRHDLRELVEGISPRDRDELADGIEAFEAAVERRRLTAGSG